MIMINSYEGASTPELSTNARDQGSSRTLLKPKPAEPSQGPSDALPNQSELSIALPGGCHLCLFTRPDHTTCRQASAPGPSGPAKAGSSPHRRLPCPPLSRPRHSSNATLHFIAIRPVFDIRPAIWWPLILLPISLKAAHSNLSCPAGLTKTYVPSSSNSKIHPLPRHRNPGTLDFTWISALQHSSAAAIATPTPRNDALPCLTVRLSPSVLT